MSEKVIQKTYQLLSSKAPTAPIFMAVSSSEQVRIDVLKSWRPYMIATIIDGEGVSRVIRFKLGSTSIYLTDQIRDGIPANAKFTEAERKAVHFRNGQLITDIPILQKFLEASPQFDKFDGKSPEDIRPAYQLYAKDKAVTNRLNDIRRSVKAANKIDRIDLAEAHELLLRINGTGTDLPENIDEAKVLLIDLIEASTEALDEVLKKDITVDDEINVLIGKLVHHDLLSFDAVDGQVAVKRDGVWKGVRALSSEYAPEDRQKYLVEFLASDSGRPLLESLYKELEEKTKKPEKILEPLNQ